MDKCVTYTKSKYGKDEWKQVGCHTGFIIEYNNMQQSPHLINQGQLYLLLKAYSSFKYRLKSLMQYLTM